MTAQQQPVAYRYKDATPAEQASAPTEPKVIAALRELLDAWVIEMPCDDAEAQNAWADRRAKARNDAAAILIAHPQGAADRSAEAIQAFLEAQDALDNRELQGPNAEDYFVLLRRRNAARHDLDAAMGTPAAAEPGKGEGK